MKGLLVAVVAALALAVPAVADEGEFSPTGSSGLALVSTWSHLTPGDRYWLVTEVYASEDDTTPYTLGDTAKTVNAIGRIQFVDEVDYLTAYVVRPYETKACLYHDGDTLQYGQPALDAQGLPLCAESYFPSY